MGRFKNVLFPLVVGVVVGCLGTALLPGCNAGGGSFGGTEEYKVVHPEWELDAGKNEKMLNELGKQGWKLRAVGHMGAVTFYLAR